MRTLTNTPLFGMFTSYVEGSELMPGNLPAAYDDFVGLLTNLPQDGDGKATQLCPFWPRRIIPFG